MRRLSLLALLVVSVARAQSPVLPGPGLPIAGGGGTSLSLDCVSSCPTAGGGTTTQAVTLSTAHTNDIIIVGSQSNGVTISSITDTASLSWAKRASVVGGGASTDVEEWWALSTGALSSDVITVHYSGSASFSEVTAFGINGAHTAAPYDTNVALPFTTTGGNAQFTTSNANDILVALSANSCTPSSPWIAIAAVSFWTVQYQIVSSTQSGSAVSCSAISIGDAIKQGP